MIDTLRIHALCTFLAASCSFLPHVPDPHAAETLAVKHGLALTNDMGLHSIQIESDAL